MINALLHLLLTCITFCIASQGRLDPVFYFFTNFAFDDVRYSFYNESRLATSRLCCSWLSSRNCACSEANVSKQLDKQLFSHPPQNGFATSLLPHPNTHTP